MAIFWTLQTEEGWNIALRRGYLEGNAAYAMYPEEYLWMMEQMRRRLPRYNGEYPIWLWIEKPDMRSTGHFNSYTKCVRLTVELDERDVLISDFYDWTSVLNNDFIAHNEQEYNDFYAGKLSLSLEESWERIFDYPCPRDEGWDGTHLWLQGVTGRVYLEQVKKVEHFVSRKQGVI
ncbi:DUF3841 domain-containing protein [Cohnella xylanilytica]|uniref:DUF3841 domain-containing protein n=1 Tax=Cohnella xylanilytica TaxID=557555 RepID=A0A841U6D6_9BACL|nr:DUF3841 domain-containing protein [Cohnella xylanilytica]MBB6693560.1 DUF3841 domain-containing protein [Cohnella xylanilytica]